MDINKLHSTAEKLFNSGEHLKARETFIQICSLEPDNAQAWHMRSTISGILGDFQDAASCSEHAISINPNIAAVYFNYGRALIELKRYENSLDALKRSIDLDASNSDCLCTMGDLYNILGDIMESESCYRRAIKISSSATAAHNNLAALMFNTGQYKSAVKICGEILALDNFNNAAFILLCNCALVPDAFDDAIKIITQAAGFSSEYLERMYGTARLLYKRKDYKETEEILSAAISFSPDDKKLKLLLGMCLVDIHSFKHATTILDALEKTDLTLNELINISDLWMRISAYDRAEACLVGIKTHLPEEVWPTIKLARIDISRGEHKKAISLLEESLPTHPGSAELLTELGYTCYIIGDLNRAIEYNRQAIEIKPEYALPHNNMGIIHKQKHNYQDALACFKEAIRLAPDNLQAQCNKASTYNSLHEYGKAIDDYNAILEKAPSCEAALTGKSVTLERTGNKELAFQLVSPLVEAGSMSIITLNAYARTCAIAGLESDAIQRLETALEDTSLSRQDRMQTYFNLGRLHDHVSNYERAFQCYKSGNDLSQDSFDRNTHKQYTDMLAAAFTRDKMSTYPSSTNTSNMPIFIVGMPRSGTSLVEQILSAHPAVHGAGELIHIRNIASSIKSITGSQEVFPLNLDSLTTGILDQLSSMYLQQLTQDARDEPHITDKMPSNFLYIGLLEMLFPGTRIIHCTRNPIDTCLSCYFQQFKKSQYFSHQLSDTAFYYNCYRRLMDHWKSTVKIPIFDVMYEDMVTMQEEKSRELVDFVGLDWHPDCLDFHKTGRQVITASYDQVRKPIYKSSAGRWKNYEAHLGDLIENLEYQ